jgi:hypothetical protein
MRFLIFRLFVSLPGPKVERFGLLDTVVGLFGLGTIMRLLVVDFYLLYETRSMLLWLWMYSNRATPQSSRLPSTTFFVCAFASIVQVLPAVTTFTMWSITQALLCGTS